MKCQNPIFNWFRHNWLGVIGVIVGIIGIYLYCSTQKRRELTTYVYPIRSIILQYGKPSVLQVLYDTQEIQNSITAVQIAIWNAGKEAIKEENILNTAQIVAIPTVRILEATVRYRTREITGFHLSDSLWESGVVPLSWRIFEHNDGAIIELIYVGSPDVKFQFNGTIEGQRNIACHEFTAKLQSPYEQIRMRKIERLFVLLSACFATLIAIGITYLTERRMRNVIAMQADYRKTVELTNRRISELSKTKSKFVGLIKDLFDYIIADYGESVKRSLKWRKTARLAYLVASIFAAAMWLIYFLTSTPTAPPFGF